MQVSQESISKMYVLLVMFLLNTSYGKYLEPRHSNYLLPFPGCSEDFFKCENENCLDLSFVCNGIDDCQDDSDEDNCETDLELNTTASKTFTQIGSALNNIKKEIILIKDFFETDYSTGYSDDDGPNMKGQGLVKWKKALVKDQECLELTIGHNGVKMKLLQPLKWLRSSKLTMWPGSKMILKGGPIKISGYKFCFLHIQAQQNLQWLRSLKLIMKECNIYSISPGAEYRI